ncbi:unnamed protein product, partial [Agarophyton chilense]
CTPGHEHHAFRDAVVLLSRFVKEACAGGGEAPRHAGRDGDEGEHKGDGDSKASTGGDPLEKELDDLRRGGSDKVFTRVVADVKGAVFLRVNDQKADLEQVVERALLEARQTGNAGSRHCIRVLPIYGTCYAKVDTAITVALTVVKEHFPVVERQGGVSYAIVFRARLNNSAKRDAYIDAIAAAIHAYEPRYKVDLTKPDVVLIVEVMKTSCCIGTFRKYYQLAKLNLREAACPSNPKQTKKERATKEKDENVDKVANRATDQVAGQTESKVTATDSTEIADGAPTESINEAANVSSEDVANNATNKLAPEISNEADNKAANEDEPKAVNDSAPKACDRVGSKVANQVAPQIGDEVANKVPEECVYASKKTKESEQKSESADEGEASKAISMEGTVEEDDEEAAAK